MHRPGPPFVPKAVMKGIARRIMFVPMWIWGRWGTPCPLPAPVHIVIGRPIVVPQMDDPTNEEVWQALILTLNQTLCSRG